MGLGVLSTIELAVSAIRAETGYAYNVFLNYLALATYHACVLVWAFYLWAPERSPQYAVRILPEADLENWNRELQRLLNR